jgi:hypothetical protein
MGAEPCGSAPLGRARCPRRVGLGRTPPRRVGLGCTGPPPRVAPLLLRLFVLGWVATLLLRLFVLGWVATLLRRLFVLDLGCTLSSCWVGSRPSSSASSCWLGFDSSTSAPIRRTTLVALVVDLPLAVTVGVLVDRRGRGGCRCSRVRKPSCLRVYRRWALLFVSGPTHPARWSSSRRRWAGFAGVGLRWGDSSPLLLVVSPLHLLVVWLVLLLLVSLLLVLVVSPLRVVSSSSVSLLLRLTPAPPRNSLPGLPTPRLPPSPDPPSSEVKPPTSLWKGEGRLGLHPRL